MFFPIQNGDFPMKHGVFPIRHRDFPIKHGGFPSPHTFFGSLNLSSRRPTWKHLQDFQVSTLVLRQIQVQFKLVNL